MGGSTGDANPEAVNSRIPAPLHTIALGDTSLQKDIRILRLLHNDVAGLGNRFPIEIELGAQGYQGPSEVRLTGPGVNLSQEVNFNGSGAPVTVQFLIEAELPGIQRYRVNVSAAENEENTATTNGRPSSTSLKTENASCWPGLPPTPIKVHGPMHSPATSTTRWWCKPLMTSTPMTQKGAGMQPSCFRSMQGTMTAVEAYSALRDAGIPVGLIMDPLGDFSSIARWVSALRST